MNDNKRTLLTLFIAYLKRRNIYYLFIRNLQLTRCRDYPWCYNIEKLFKGEINVNAVKLMNSSFSWEDTHEGFKFWQRENALWEDITYKFNIENKNHMLLLDNKKYKDIMSYIIKNANNESF